MKKSAMIASAAIVGLLSTGSIIAAPADANAEEKVKCYGVAKAGQNDCGAADGSHACAGLAKTDNDPNEWKMMEKDKCEEMGGSQMSAVEKKKMESKS